MKKGGKVSENVNLPITCDKRKGTWPNPRLHSNQRSNNITQSNCPGRHAIICQTVAGYRCEQENRNFRFYWFIICCFRSVFIFTATPLPRRSFALIIVIILIQQASVEVSDTTLLEDLRLTMFPIIQFQKFRNRPGSIRCIRLDRLIIVWGRAKIDEEVLKDGGRWCKFDVSRRWQSVQVKKHNKR